MTRYRVAIIGTGGIAEFHMRAVKSLEEQVEVVAAVDVDRPRVEAYSAKHSIPASYTDVADMLEKEHPDLVQIATPPATHYALIIQALQAGAHVLCEKPLCLSLAELDEIQAIERATGKYCSSVFQWRFGSAGRHFKQLIQEGSLGRPLLGMCQTTWFRNQAYYQVPWRGKWVTEGGGPTMGHGIHAIDLFLWLLGDWEEISALMDTLDHEIEVEDVSLALVRFKNRALGSIVNSVISPREETRLRFDFQRATVELTALYSYTNENWRFTPLPAEETTLLSHWRALKEDYASSHTAQLSDLVERLERGERPLAGTVDVRPTIECLSAIYKSAMTGQSVRQGSILPGDPYYQHVAGQVNGGKGS